MLPWGQRHKTKDRFGMQLGKTTEAEEVEAVVEAVRPLFAGKRPEIQGAALADLLAMWLAGHVDRDDPEGKNSALIQEELIEIHLAMVRQLIPINYAMLIEPELDRRWNRH
jgi:hypothetical protein